MKNVDLSVEIAGVKFRNPIIAASGTFGEDTLPFINLNEFGGIVLKGIYLDENLSFTPTVREFYWHCIFKRTFKTHSSNSLFMHGWEF
jgi:hypothetical protein